MFDGGYTDVREISIDMDNVSGAILTKLMVELVSVADILIFSASLI